MVAQSSDGFLTLRNLYCAEGVVSMLCSRDICTLRNLYFNGGPMLGCWLRNLYFDGAELSMRRSRDIRTL